MNFYTYLIASWNDVFYYQLKWRKFPLSPSSPNSSRSFAVQCSVSACRTRNADKVARSFVVCVYVFELFAAKITFWRPRSWLQLRNKSLKVQRKLRDASNCERKSALGLQVVSKGVAEKKQAAAAAVTNSVERRNWISRQKSKRRKHRRENNWNNLGKDRQSRNGASIAACLGRRNGRRRPRRARERQRRQPPASNAAGRRLSNDEGRRLRQQGTRRGLHVPPMCAEEKVSIPRSARTAQEAASLRQKFHVSRLWSEVFAAVWIETSS